MSCVAPLSQRCSRVITARRRYEGWPQYLQHTMYNEPMLKEIHDLPFAERMAKAVEFKTEVRHPWIPLSQLQTASDRISRIAPVCAK